MPLRHPYFRISILRGLCLLSILPAYTSMREDFFWGAGFIFHFIFLSAMGMGKGIGQPTPLGSQAGLVRWEDRGPCY